MCSFFVVLFFYPNDIINNLLFSEYSCATKNQKKMPNSLAKENISFFLKVR